MGEELAVAAALSQATAVGERAAAAEVPGGETTRPLGLRHVDDLHVTTAPLRRLPGVRDREERENPPIGALDDGDLVDAARRIPGPEAREEARARRTGDVVEGDAAKASLMAVAAPLDSHRREVARERRRGDAAHPDVLARRPREAREAGDDAWPGRAAHVDRADAEDGAPTLRPPGPDVGGGAVRGDVAVEPARELEMPDEPRVPRLRTLGGRLRAQGERNPEKGRDGGEAPR